MTASVTSFPRKMNRRIVPDTVAKAFAEFEKSIGGRPALVAALSMAFSDVIVIGNVLEENPGLLKEFTQAIQNF